MWLFIVWLLPIIVLFWLKWRQLNHGTIKDLLCKDVNPICKECGYCDDTLISIDWIIFIPIIGFIGIIWVLFDDKFKNIYQKIQKWLNTPIK